MKILILYHSKSGHTLEAAHATASGIRAAGSEAKIVAVKDFNANTLSDYDGLIIGSPCWSGSVNGSGIAGPLKKVINKLPSDFISTKRCGGISVFAFAGGQNTVRALKKVLSEKGCRDFKSGPATKAGVALSLWKGPSVTEQDEDLFKAYGTQFVA